VYISDISALEIYEAIMRGLMIISGVMVFAMTSFIFAHKIRTTPLYFPLAGLIAIVAVILIFGIYFTFFDDRPESKWTVLGITLGCFIFWGIMQATQSLKLFNSKTLWTKIRPWIKEITTLFEIITLIFGAFDFIAEGFEASLINSLGYSIIVGFAIIWTFIGSGLIWGKGGTGGYRGG
jgi:hypothetical protein